MIALLAVAAAAAAPATTMQAAGTAQARGPVQTSDTDVDRIADRYLDAVAAQDWDEMRVLLAPEAVYIDRTMQYFDRETIDLVGTEAILGFWRQASEDSDTREIQFDVRSRFRAGPVVVYELTTSVRVSGAYWGIDREELPFSASQVTILEVVDGRVTRHEDHVDYGEVMRQLDGFRGEPRPPERR
jgi:predicted ester cyclase